MRCKSGHANIFRREVLTRVILKKLSMLLSVREGYVMVALLSTTARAVARFR